MVRIGAPALRVVHRIEDAGALDGIGGALQGFVSRCVRPRAVRNLLSGTNLGHPLHPMLTDVPIGMWTAAALIDVVGGRSNAGTADALVGAGIAAAVPTALTGLNDWSDTYGAETRVGIVHAAANSTALTLYIASLALRRGGHRVAGRALGFMGFGVLLTGGYLGGHLSYSRGVNVNHTAFERRPSEWTAVATDADVAEGAALKVEADGVSVLLHRRQGQLYALASTCSHMGGPLHEGTIDDGCVTCPWHGSEFRLSDGYIVRGPASAPQPTYDTRVVGGRIEVRARR